MRSDVWTGVFLGGLCFVATAVFSLASADPPVSAPSSVNPAPVTPTSQPTVNVAAELAQLRTQKLADVGRGSLVEQYETLVNNAGTDPQAADAMMDLAAIWEARIDAKSIRPNPVEALKWYRRAAAAAATDSSTWTSARFYVAWRVGYTNPAEARRALDEINHHAKDFITDLRIEDSLIAISLRENKLDEAISHANRVLSAYEIPGEVPDDADARKLVDGLISDASSSIMSGITATSLDASDRRNRIKKIMAEHADVAAVQHDGEESIKQIDAESTAGTASGQ